MNPVSPPIPCRGRPAARCALAGLLAAAVPLVHAQEPAPTEDTPPPAPAADVGIRLNFRDAPLGDVLEYLSEAAGFVILQDVAPQGEVTVVSHQPLSADEAADLVISILHEKGYGAVRNNRILKVVPLSEAHRQYLPVRTGADAESIPRSDEMVTQIIPVRYVDAEELLETLLPLLGEDAKLTANESSNALVMTDTLSNVRRTVEIISALDTSVSTIATLRVFPLEYADAADLAEVLNDLFENAGGSSNQGQSRTSGGPGTFFDRFRGGGRPDGGGR